MQLDEPIAPHTVVLRHDLPDGSWHVDWMLDLDPNGEGGLVTFRLAQRPDRLAGGQRLTAKRLEDHRRTYLTYEGPVSGNRGTVERLAAGTFDAIQCVGDQWAFLIQWQDASSRRWAQRLRLDRIGSAWQVSAIGSANQRPTAC